MKLFVHEYPKSGGSWLVNLLGEALGLPKRDIYVTDGFGLFDIWKHPWYRGTAGLGLTVDCVVKSHELPGSELVRPFAEESKHLCLVRDGRDVVVSKYFFERDFCVRNGISAGFDIPFDDFVRRTAPEWSAHVQSWLAAGVPIFHYQEFLADPVAALRAVCASVHRHEVGEAELRAAVAANTPERMRRSLDDTFAHNTFVRVAGAGDWRNHFSPANERDFLDAAGGTLARLGYARYAVPNASLAMDDSTFALPTLNDLLAAVDEVGRLYPLTPPLVFWRAYERALYARLAPRLEEPVLDVGCGDGAFFSLLWPDCTRVDGIDCDPAAVARAHASGRYREVWEGFAHEGPLPTGHYGAAVSNCALEHMDEIDAVLRRIHGSLRPGGVFVGSVVTDRFISWNSLPTLFTHLDGGRTAAHIQSAYEDYHHLRNAFPAEEWVARFTAAGFTVERVVPFLGEFSSRLFLFLDNLWHLGSDQGIPRGPLVEGYLASFPGYGQALRRLVEGAYLAERDRTAGSGLFLVARRAAPAPPRELPGTPAALAQPDSSTPRCWCGDAAPVGFSPDYLRCPECDTLVVRAMPGEQISQVRDDEHDFYGKNYYLRHVQEDYGLPNLETRARADLPERCLHWLRAFLKFAPAPDARGSDDPVRALELGCGHGGFVAMLRWAGFDATGLELSPWLVERAREWFGIPMLTGRLEEQDLPDGFLDCVALMDVLEHLPAPRGTMARAARLLRPGGFLLVQTPCFPAGGITYEQMVAEDHPFLMMLKPMEHLYLFSRKAARRLFAELGLGEVRFEPAIFGHYDMFFTASAAPLVERPEKECEARLEKTLPAGRAALALLDLGRERDRQTGMIAERGTARAAHLEQIETLTALLKTSEADREVQRTQAERVTAQLGELTTMVHAREDETAARLEQIETLNARLKTSETDREVQRAQAERVTAQLGELTARLKTSEADREVQRAQAERVTAQLGELTAMVHAREGEAGIHLEQIETLNARLKTSEADREAQRAHAGNLLAQLVEMTKRFTQQESESAARLEQVLQLTAMVHAAQAERDRGVEGPALRAGSTPESGAEEALRKVEAAAAS